MKGATGTAHRRSALAAAATLVFVATAPAASGTSTLSTTDDFTEDTYGGLLLGEGSAGFPVDTEFDIMLDAEDRDIPTDLEIWAFPESGQDPVLIGSGEPTSEEYINPGALDPEPQAVELLEVNLPGEEVHDSQWYAFAAFNASNGNLVTWTAYQVMGEDDPAELDSEPADIWPIPDPQDRTEPSTEPPTRELLTPESYGVVSLIQDDAMLGLDEPSTVEVATSVITVDLWLMPPGDEEAVFLPASLLEEDPDNAGPRWQTEVNSEDIAYSGIYGLAAVHEEDGLLGWSPFGITLDGEELQPGDPGVHESEAGFADRSIWPIPNSVPGPGENNDDEPTSTPDDETTSPEPGTPTPQEEPPASSVPTDQAGQGLPLLFWGLLGVGAMLALGLAVVISTRRKNQQDQAPPQ